MPVARVSQVSSVSRVMPQSMTIAGSSIASGTGPSAGGVSCFAHCLIAARRSATTSGQCAAARRGTRRPRGHQVDDRGLELVVCQVKDVFGVGEEFVRASNAPNSRILLKNRLVYQCSQ